MTLAQPAPGITLSLFEHPIYGADTHTWIPVPIRKTSGTAPQ